MNPKRLVIYLGCAAAVYIIGAKVVAPLLPDPQRDNMRRVDAHIALIKPQWEEFKRTNGGLELVRLRPDAREDGLYAVTGYVTSQVQVAEVLKFITATEPPRPFYTNAFKVVTPEDFEIYKASEIVPANRSQPVRPETNRASPAAGSRRSP